ncbi:MAG: OmpA family protein [Neomegalonema sp.]|nr:OmpA family protein [Neomegalonema sp.]
MHAQQEGKLLSLDDLRRALRGSEGSEARPQPAPTPAKPAQSVDETPDTVTAAPSADPVPAQPQTRKITLDDLRRVLAGETLDPVESDQTEQAAAEPAPPKPVASAPAQGAEPPQQSASTQTEPEDRRKQVEGTLIAPPLPSERKMSLDDLRRVLDDEHGAEETPQISSDINPAMPPDPLGFDPNRQSLSADRAPVVAPSLASDLGQASDEIIEGEDDLSASATVQGSLRDPQAPGRLAPLPAPPQGAPSARVAANEAPQAPRPPGTPGTSGGEGNLEEIVSASIDAASEPKRVGEAARAAQDRKAYSANLEKWVCKAENNFEQNVVNAIALPEHPEKVSLYFSPGSFAVNFGNTAMMVRNAPRFREIVEGGDRLMIVGYTDRTGNPTANVILSLQRAYNVKACIISLFGIPEEAIEVSGHGSFSPIREPQEPTIDGNRRVDVVPMSLYRKRFEDTFFELNR